MGEKWSRTLTGRVCSDVVAVLVCHSEERAEPKSKAVNLLVDLCSNPHLFPRAVGSDQKNKTVGTSGGNELPPQGVWVQPWEVLREE